LAAFQQTVQHQAQARLDELGEDSYLSRLSQHRLLSLWHNATWSGTETAATVTLTTAGYYAAVHDAVEALQTTARAHGFRLQVHLEPDEGDTQDRAEDALNGLIDTE
jgi:hypothetical protein